MRGTGTRVGGTVLYTVRVRRRTRAAIEAISDSAPPLDRIGARPTYRHVDDEWPGVRQLARTRRREQETLSPVAYGPAAPHATGPPVAGAGASETLAARRSTQSARVRVTPAAADRSARHPKATRGGRRTSH